MTISIKNLITAATAGLPEGDRVDTLDLDCPQGLSHLLLAGMTCQEIAEAGDHHLEDVVDALESYLGVEFKDIRLKGQAARQALESEARKAAYWAVRGKAHEAAEIRRESHRVLSGFQARAACELASA